MLDTPGMAKEYPASAFLKVWEPDSEHVANLKKTGSIILQKDMSPSPVDDMYADGRPYRGSGKLEGKSAWIAGGDSGIGRSTAILFAIEGADITISYLPEEQGDAEDVRQYIDRNCPGRKVNFFPTDLSLEKNCIAAIESHIEAFGTLDILVNSAAQQRINHDITTLDSKQWEASFQLNMHAFFYTSKAAIPHMPRGSSIINMGSINSFLGRPDLLDYTSTKGAIVAFTRGLSNQLLPEKQIRVNCIAPGPIWTPLVPATFSVDDAAAVEAAPVPMRRSGQPVEVATCCVFLASQDSSYISGQTLHPNGGTVIG